MVGFVLGTDSPLILVNAAVKARPWAGLKGLDALTKVGLHMAARWSVLSTHDTSRSSSNSKPNSVKFNVEFMVKFKIKFKIRLKCTLNCPESMSFQLAGVFTACAVWQSLEMSCTKSHGCSGKHVS